MYVGRRLKEEEWWSQEAIEEKRGKKTPPGRSELSDMEWRKCYLDVVLVPLGLFITMGYHVWLWHKVRTQPLSTFIGMNVNGRRFWVSAMMKVLNTNHPHLIFPSCLIRTWCLISYHIVLLIILMILEETIMRVFEFFGRTTIRRTFWRCRLFEMRSWGRP